MRTTTLLALITLLASPLAWQPAAFAGTVYKVVDENGKVHFTDHDPAASQPGVRVQEVAVNQDAANRSSVTQVGTSQFCGTIRLPSRQNYGSGFFESLASNKGNWKRSLESLERQTEQLTSSHSSYYYNKSSFDKNYSPEKLEQMRDYRCAIGWAEDQERLSRDEMLRLGALVTQQNSLVNRLVGAQAEACGPEPQFGMPDYSEHRRAWSKCSQPYQEQINQGRHALQDADRQLAGFRQNGQ